MIAGAAFLLGFLIAAAAGDMRLFQGHWDAPTLSLEGAAGLLMLIAPARFLWLVYLTVIEWRREWRS